MIFEICKICHKYNLETRKTCCVRVPPISGPLISEQELELIRSEGHNLDVIEENGLYQFLYPQCPFMQNGCILKNKPLSCEIYPFIPTKNGWAVRTSCPYWNEFTVEELEQVKKEFEGKKANWRDRT